MRRWTWRRRGTRRLLATAAAAVIAGAVTARVVARADELATAYGQRQPVPVAVRELATGTEIGTDDWEWRELPVQLFGGTPADEPTGPPARHDAQHDPEDHDDHGERLVQWGALRFWLVQPDPHVQAVARVDDSGSDSKAGNRGDDRGDGAEELTTMRFQQACETCPVDEG